MQFYDLLMLAVMAGAVLFGFWKGFAWQVASLAAIFVSYFVARNFHAPVANMIGGDPAWNRFLAMFILFMGSSLLIWLGFGFVKSSIERMHLKGFDRQIGAGLGAVKGLILCTIVTLFAVSLLGESTCRSICTSRSGNYIAQILGHAGGLVPEEIGKHINPYIDEFHNKIDNHKNDLPVDPQNELQPGQQNGQNGFQPNLQNPYGNPNMTQGYNVGAPNERVGQLEPTQNGQPRQPAYNGQWQRPAYNPPVNNQTGSTQNGGTFQLPNVPKSWQESVRDGVTDAVKNGAQQAIEETWRRAMGEGK